LPDTSSVGSVTLDSGFLSLFISPDRRQCEGMQAQKRSRKIRLPAAPDFCWPVKIRVRATMYPSAPHTFPDLPASSVSSVKVTVEVRQSETFEATAHEHNPGTSNIPNSFAQSLSTARPERDSGPPNNSHRLMESWPCKRRTR
jgi:hypothetical protein